MHGQKPAWLAIRSIAMLGICLLLACTEAGREPPEGGKASTGPLAAGESCSLDLECRGGLRCDPERQICVCTSDASCPAPLRCDPFSGRCLREPEGCERDADCGPGRWCEERSRVCRPVRDFCAACEPRFEGDCGPGNRCLPEPAGAGHFCAASCSRDDDCSRPRTSCIQGQCVPQQGCADVAPCHPDSGKACVGDAGCDPGQRCDAERGVCVAGHSGCEPEEICHPITLDCYTPCGGDADCGSTERCEAGACVALPACTEGDECPPPGICRILPGQETGSCLRGCRESADCPRPRVCVVEPGEAIGSCEPGCGSDEACPLGQRCVSRDGRSLCVDGCEADADCPLHQVCACPEDEPDCEQRMCRAIEGRCQITDSCDFCEVCGDDGRCTFARIAGAPAANYCGGCFGDGLDPACGPGGICSGGRCAPACPPGGCPRGFSCQPVRAGPGNELHPVCFPNLGICDRECL